MIEYKVEYGQDIFSITETLYGSQDYLFKLLQDNNLSVVSDVDDGDIILYDETIKNNIIDYYKLNNVIANNSDWVTGLIPLAIDVYKIIPSFNNVTGAIYTNITGGRGIYSIEWRNVDTNTLIATDTTFITGLPSGTFNIKVTDITSETINTDIIVGVADNATYWIDENGNYVSTENDDNIVFDDGE